jgi:cobalamin biosynthesis Mg chelatase CobN
MELKPCTNCGNRVTDLDISQGDGVSVAGKFYCRQCAKDLDMKSDYTAVSALSSRRNLSDTLFFTRAGKMYDDAGGAQAATRRRRPRGGVRTGAAGSDAPKGARAQAQAQAQARKMPWPLIIGIMGAVVAILLVVVVILVIYRR